LIKILLSIYFYWV